MSDPSHKEWTIWDYRLLKAHYIIQDWYRDGIPIWWDESDRVTFNAEARVSKSRAAIERAQEKDKKKVPGKYYIAKPVPMGGAELPTRDEWIEEQNNKTTSPRPSPQRREPNVLQGRK